MAHALFTPTKLGDIEIANRIALAPLTRNRADPETGAPRAMNAEYYAQRASGGLLITEASQISPQGKGYAYTPGIHSDAQVKGWRLVTDAVHERGGKIVLQLWHVGRISHVDLQQGGAQPVSSTDRAAKVKTFLEDGKGFAETSAPRRLEEGELAGIVNDYARAAERAVEAGFDGVEIHGANGYLIDQFLKDGVNDRTDRYGGSIENRVRFMSEVVDAVTGAIGAGRTGIRLSPFSGANDAMDSDPMATFGHAIERLSGRGLAFLHMVEGQTGGPRDLQEGWSIEALRAKFDGAYVANNGYDRAMAMEAVESGRAEAIAFGKPYIANPDLPERLEKDAPLNEPNPKTFYGGGAEGYTDYPFLKDAEAA